MLKTRSVLLVVALLGWTSVADARSQLSYSSILYSALTQYSQGASKKSAVNAGAYVYAGYGVKESYELAADYTTLKYTNGDNYQQADLTYAFTYFSRENWKARLGIHSIMSSSKLADTGYTIIGGFNSYVPYDWNYGADFYYSMYTHYDVLGDQYKPSVMQISPYFGFLSKSGKVYSETRASYISAAKATADANGSYASIEQSFSVYFDGFTIDLSGWSGQRVYPVTKGGFVVINTPDLYRSGWSLSGKLVLSQSMALTVGGSSSIYKEEAIGTDVSSLTWFATLGITL